MEEANEQMFEGDPWMAQRLRNRAEFTFMLKHGLLTGTSEAPRIFSLSFDKSKQCLKEELCKTTLTCHFARDVIYMSMEW